MSIQVKMRDATLAPWLESGWEVTGDDCFDERPLEFSGRRSTDGEEETFGQKLLNGGHDDIDDKTWL